MKSIPDYILYVCKQETNGNNNKKYIYLYR